jgi:phosphohistidine phosphatase SixA
MKLLICLCLVSTNLVAQTSAIDSSATTPAQAGSSTLPPNLPPHPLVDPARELKGAALIDALRAGGFILYLRHTDTGRVTRDCVESNLSPAGEEQAKRIGAVLRALKIPIGQIESSEVCRVQDTARLLGIGAVQTNEALNNMPKRPGHELHAARARRLALPAASGTNTLLVGHLMNGASSAERIALEIGEIIVFRPDGKGGTNPVARIRITDWAALEQYR